MKNQRSPLTALTLLLLLASPACRSGSESDHPPGSPPAAPVLTEPQVLQQVDPDFSEETSKFLATSDVKLTLEFLITVRKDGAATAVKVVRAEPADLPVSRRFADEVAASIPRWRFRPATANGNPMDAEWHFVMEAQGAGGTEVGK